jgi:hypothetical protein
MLTICCANVLGQVRLGEKETLDSTLRFFEERLERVPSLEFYQVGA